MLSNLFRKSVRAMKGINRALLIVVFCLVVLRIFLPPIVKYGLNWVLENKLENYTGHVADVDLAIWRGAYRLEELFIRQKNIPLNTPSLLHIDKSEISLSWHSLFQGKVLANVSLTRAVVNFVHNPSEKVSQFGGDEKTENWRAVFDRIIPVKINNFQIANSQVHFKNPGAKPPIDIFLDKTQVLVENISNERGDKNHMSRVSAKSFVMGDALIETGGRINVLDEPSKASIQLRMQRLQLQKLNPFFEYYGNVSLNEGTFDNILEFDLANNQIDGYTKSFMKNVDVIANGESYNEIMEIVSEVLLASATWVAKNSETKASAFYLPFSGPINDPKFEYWPAAKSALKNGFSKPLARGFEKKHRYIE